LSRNGISVRKCLRGRNLAEWEALSLKEAGCTATNRAGGERELDSFEAQAKQEKRGYRGASESLSRGVLSDRC